MGVLQLSPEEVFTPPEEVAKTQVNFWKTRIIAASKLSSYVDYQKDKEAAKEFFKGNFFTQKEKDAWEGDIVEANLFRRTVNFMVDAIYTQNPKIRVTSRTKSKVHPRFYDIMEEHLNYIFEEENLRSEVRKVWKDSFFGNLSVAKLDFDRARGIWRAKWVAGLFICDPDARGDISRAKWVAEQVIIPRYRIWQDESFDPLAREKIKERASKSDVSYTENKGFEINSKEKSDDCEFLWYIYTKEGIEPLKDINGGSKLLVYCEGYDGWLMNIDNPTPFLDNDEFPYMILRLDEMPGEFIGPAMWRTISSVVVAFNWASSYHMSDMRKTASSPIGYDKNKIDDPDKIFKSRKHKVPIPIEGNPSEALAPLNVGQADKTIFDSVAFFYDMLNKLTGIDQIARGEEGKTKTATESQILQQNSNIVLRGPSAALDYFLNDMIRKIALASLYYIPAFSIVPGPIGPGGSMPMIFMTRQAISTPVINSMTGMPAIDPSTGQIQMQQQIVSIPAQGATQAMRGIDFFHGDEAALAWPQVAYDEIKCELFFSVEAGSTRLERRVEKQRQVTELINTLGTELLNLGFWGERWELWKQYLDAFEVPDRSKLLPVKEIFVQQAMMAQQMMAQQSVKGNPGNFEQNQNSGKDFPMGRNESGKDESTGT